MTTTEDQAEFLDSIMQELEADPATTLEDREILKAGHDYIKPLLKPQGLKAGYQDGYYYVKLNGSTKLTTRADIEDLGFKHYFLEPPFKKPVMLKKRS